VLFGSSEGSPDCASGWAAEELDRRDAGDRCGLNKPERKRGNEQMPKRRWNILNTLIGLGSMLFTLAVAITGYPAYNYYRAENAKREAEPSASIDESLDNKHINGSNIVVRGTCRTCQEMVISG
jgi:hypothetical protein